MKKTPSHRHPPLNTCKRIAKDVNGARLTGQQQKRPIFTSTCDQLQETDDLRTRTNQNRSVARSVASPMQDAAQSTLARFSNVFACFSARGAGMHFDVGS